MPTPYRIVVFTASHAYMGWTKQQHYQEARLPSAGSFSFPGPLAVRRAAMEYLADPATKQVSIRTNQDKRIHLFIKKSDGKITGYRPD